jgi:hypothetical protein
LTYRRGPLEAAPAGTRLNAVGDEGVPFLDIAQAIGRHLNLPVTAISREEADGHFGLFALSHRTTSRPPAP